VGYTGTRIAERIAAALSGRGHSQTARTLAAPEAGSAVLRA
jgi:hypothetical protein